MHVSHRTRHSLIRGSNSLNLVIEKGQKALSCNEEIFVIYGGSIHEPNFQSLL